MLNGNMVQFMMYDEASQSITRRFSKILLSVYFSNKILLAVSQKEEAEIKK